MQYKPGTFSKVCGGGRVQTNFENSAEYRISAEIRFRLNRNRTQFSKVWFRFKRNRNWLKKFGFNRILTEFCVITHWDFMVKKIPLTCIFIIGQIFPIWLTSTYINTQICSSFKGDTDIKGVKQGVQKWKGKNQLLKLFSYLLIKFDFTGLNHNRWTLIEE